MRNSPSRNRLVKNIAGWCAACTGIDGSMPWPEMTDSANRDKSGTNNTAFQMTASGKNERKRKAIQIDKTARQYIMLFSSSRI
mmetsp:Transcript_11302/g.14878  ORF Transcript_11302/g.14878 Transcript_11302/m.14878 type:complete len:83 (+) Transcript_11302:169-417(+)